MFKLWKIKSPIWQSKHYYTKEGAHFVNGSMQELAILPNNVRRTSQFICLPPSQQNKDGK